MPRGGKAMSKSAALGRSIDNRRRHESRGRLVDGQRLGGTKQVGLHTTDAALDTRPNIMSVIHQNDLDELMNTAELSQRQFTAEKDNMVVLDNSGFYAEQLDAPSALQLSHQALHETLVRIPRRPAWHHGMSAEELDIQERDSFLHWRRQLVQVEQDEKILLTPFEKNLEVWRQLWRVVERSDLLVQIVDSRNPLLFYCSDLERYTQEVRPHIATVLLLNKSDFLTEDQRRVWADYFDSRNIRYIFFSAHQAEAEVARVKAATELAAALSFDSTSQSPSSSASSSSSSSSSSTFESEATESSSRSDRTRVLNREELLSALRKYRPAGHTGVFNVGMTGYPNVGKSSTINVLYGAKKAAVAATPGKTKHFQTLKLDDDLILCDCPGLVFPSFATTKASMVCNGLLPIDQLRDVLPAASIVAQNIPREVLELMYGIKLQAPGEDEDPNRPPTGKEFLEAYAYIRGFMTVHGSPDYSRAGRIILKDYVNGKLLFCYPPPSATDAWLEHAGADDGADDDDDKPKSRLGVDELNKLYHKIALEYNKNGVMSYDLQRKLTAVGASSPAAAATSAARKPTYVEKSLNPEVQNVEGFLAEDRVLTAFTTGKQKQRGARGKRTRGKQFTRVHWQHATQSQMPASVRL